MNEVDYHMLDLALADMRNAPRLYRPTAFWEQVSAGIIECIKEHGLSHFRSLREALMFFVPTYAFPGTLFRSDVAAEFQDVLVNHGLNVGTVSLSLGMFLSGEMQAFADYRVYSATVSDGHPFYDKASESEVGHPLEQFVFDGKRYSRSFLNYLLGLNFLKQHFDLSEVNTVLEIGGGFGSLGEILLGDARNHCFYIDVDIPPTNCVSSYYLQEIFGADKIADYGLLRNEERLDIGALASRFKGAVLCPWQLPKLEGKVDLFVNFISFQEMEPDVVGNYLDQVDRLKAKYVLLRNLREGKSKAKDANSIGVVEPIKGEDYSALMPNYELIAVNMVPFGYKTVDNFHSELRLYRRSAKC